MNFISIKFYNAVVGGKMIILKLVILRTLIDFFRNRHLRPPELFFGRFIQRTNRNFKKRELKCARV
jgi:hypothetical protein